MKTKKSRITVLVLAALIINILVSCNSAGTASIDLAANDVQKEAAFNQILNNQALFNEFMNKMMQDTQSIHWMMEDGEFVQHMFSHENMDYMMQHNQQFNFETMRNMMQRYSGDSTMMHNDDMMHDDDDMMHDR